MLGIDGVDSMYVGSNGCLNSIRSVPMEVLHDVHSHLNLWHVSKLICLVGMVFMSKERNRDPFKMKVIHHIYQHNENQ